MIVIFPDSPKLISMAVLDRLILFFNHCFVQFNQTKFIVYCLLIFISSLTFYYLLMLFKTSWYDRIPKVMRPYILLNAEKSDTHALQIGGIPFSIISMVAIALLFYWFPYLINPQQKDILLYSIFSWIGNLAYGYIDDLYEIRPIVKLTFQIFLISVFSVFASQIVYPEQAAFAFVGLVFLSVAILNGSNLIDGLDTLSYKVSSVIYLAYIILAAPVVNLPTLFIALACFLIMSGFYFFNKEPSKIHLGEVGVSCLGFSYIILAVLTFLDYRKINPPFSALTKALLPCVILYVEIFVSFSRRILNGKSPFKGDRNHIHHILNNSYRFSASNASSIVAFSYFIFIITALYLMDRFSSIFSFFILTGFSLIWSLGLGWREWFKNDIQVNIMDGLLVKKDIRMISYDSLADFKITVNKVVKNEQKKDNSF